MDLQYMRMYRRMIAAWVGLCILLLALGGVAGFAIGKYRYPHTAAWDLAIEDLRAENAMLEEANEAEYYRGIYDVWLWVGRTTGQPVNPNGFVIKAYENDWYVEPSQGWTWPLSE